MSRIPMLDKMSLGHRIIVTILIVMAILFALALFGFLTGGWDHAEGAQAETPADKLVKSFEQSEPPINLKHEHKILEMDRRAITKAYEDQIHLLFQNWMKDATDTSQPGRALKGARNARDAYIKSMDGIDRREQRIPQSKQP